MSNSNPPHGVLFRDLSSEEEEKFRGWARDNYAILEPINPLWHPVIRDECERINRRNRFVTKLSMDDYGNARDAVSVGACNTSGLIHTLDKVVSKIWQDANDLGKGTDWVNTHPIIVAYTYQMAYLAIHETILRGQSLTKLLDQLDDGVIGRLPKHYTDVM